MNRVAQVGKAIIWVYTQHLLTFTAGAIAGSIQTLLICAAIWL